jgi:hypothetical protein
MTMNGDTFNDNNNDKDNDENKNEIDQLSTLYIEYSLLKPLRGSSQIRLVIS